MQYDKLNLKDDGLGRASLLIFSVILLTLIVGFIFSGCSDTTTPVNAGTNSDNLSFSTIVPPGSAAVSNIVITEAKALITEMEIENKKGSHSEHIRITPFVIHFDLNGNIKEVLSSYLTADTYSKVKFKIHKPEDNEEIPDQEFRQGTRSSVIIKGTYNGQPFTYKTKKSMSIILNFNGDVQFGNNKHNLTMLINKLQWFLRNGNECDPRDEQNEHFIDDNIRDSFKNIFRDDDRNGIPDDNS